MALHFMVHKANVGTGSLSMSVTMNKSCTVVLELFSFMFSHKKIRPANLEGLCEESEKWFDEKNTKLNFYFWLTLLKSKLVS